MLVSRTSFGITALALIVANVTLADEPLQLKVLSYNIHHAEGIDGRVSLERIAEVILSSGADLVALQEVDQNVERSQNTDQPAELARLTKMKVAFGANIPLQGGHYGNAVLSRFPIRHSRNSLLPNLDAGEQRGSLQVEIEVDTPSQTLILYATHFDHRRPDQERVASAQAINETATSLGSRPMLLAGDFNATFASQTLKVLQTEWRVANTQLLPTIPVDNPTRQIDFILVRPPSRWKTVEVTVIEEQMASDHRPILATIELLPGRDE